MVDMVAFINEVVYPLRETAKKINVFEITSAWVLIVTSLYTNFFNFSVIKTNTSIDLLKGRKRFRLSMVCIRLREELFLETL